MENYYIIDKDQKQILKKQLIENAFVIISVFDIYGKIIKRLVNNKKNSGFHSIYCNSKNNPGKTVLPGV